MLSLLRRFFHCIFSLHYYRYVMCELGYFFTGMSAIADDIENKKKNKCDLLEETVSVEKDSHRESTLLEKDPCNGFETYGLTLPPPEDLNLSDSGNELFDLSGKVAVVTGGARGIGCDVVKKLLECNIHVIIGCRNIEAGQESVEKIRKNGFTTGSFDIFQLDLASLSSIKNFAQQVSKKTDKLHILVNNAGIMFTPFHLTEDGYESQWAVNYLGPFLLTHLLFPLIKKSSVESECRIINVTSCAHKLCKHFDYSDINKKSNFITGISYALSKAAQLSSTIYLSSLMQERKLNVSVFAVHPGIVNSDLFNGTRVKILLPLVFKYISKNLDEGATSVIYPCVSPNLNGMSGQYFSNCRSIKPSKFTQDVNEQKSLFLYSLDQLKIKEFGEEQKPPN